MALFELERVGKRYKRGARVALNDVSMEIHAGEMIVIWGERQSGRVLRGVCRSRLLVPGRVLPADTASGG